MTNPYATIRAALESIRVCDDMTGEREAALAALAELEKELAAAVAERDRIKGDHDEAAHFARHFIRDDPGITPRGAIIRLGDKCTDLFCRLQSAEQERDQLRARLAAIDQTTGELCSVCGWRTILAWGCEKCERDKLSKRIDAIECQPAIARIESLPGPKGGAYLYIMGVDAPPNVSSGTELIARPAKDSP